MHDIVDFCRRSDILCQGRGSAANSAVCFALGITSVDPVANHLLFEALPRPSATVHRHRRRHRSDRREEAIQYVYGKYGRDYSAQVANVITYRRKSAVRDTARASLRDRAAGRMEPDARQAPDDVTALAARAADPRPARHLGIHSGGMVICDRPIADVCPTEWARMPGAAMLQWDKDDCAAIAW